MSDTSKVENYLKNLGFEYREITSGIMKIDLGSELFKSCPTIFKPFLNIFHVETKGKTFESNRIENCVCYQTINEIQTYVRVDSKWINIDLSEEVV